MTQNINNVFSPNSANIQYYDEAFAYNEINSLISLPQEIIDLILGNISEAPLGRLCSVSKHMKVMANNEIFWQPIANKLLLAHDFEVKQNASYKDYYRDIMRLCPLLKAGENQFHTLMPRSTDLVNFIHKVPPPQFHLLNPKEAEALCQLKDSIALIQAVAKFKSIKNFEFKHIAQQKVGDNQFVFFSCTDHLINFNEAGLLQKDNQKISKLSDRPTKYSQCLIYEEKGNIEIFISGIGYNWIERISVEPSPFHDISEWQPCSNDADSIFKSLSKIQWMLGSHRSEMIFKNITKAMLARLDLDRDDFESSPAIEKIQTLNLQNYHILSYNEAIELLQNEQIALFICANLYLIDSGSYYLKYVATQKIGNYQFDYISASLHVISFNEKGEIYIDNQPTQAHFPLKPGHYQVLISDSLNISIKKIGENQYTKTGFKDINLSDNGKDNLSDIDNETLPDIDNETLPDFDNEPPLHPQNLQWIEYETQDIEDHSCFLIGEDDMDMGWYRDLLKHSWKPMD